MLSNISKMFSVVTISSYQSSILTDIELVSIQGNRIMLVLAMDTGLVKSIVLNLKIDIDKKLSLVLQQVENNGCKIDLKFLTKLEKS